MQNKLFSPLKLSSERINEYITDIVNAHQTPLLTQANRQLEAEHGLVVTQMQRLEQNHQRLQSEVESYSRVMLAQMREIEVMRNQSLAQLRPVAPAAAREALVTQPIRTSFFESFSAFFNDTESTSHSRSLDPSRAYEFTDFY